MNVGNSGNADLKQQIAINIMKKAMDVEAKEVLSVLQSATAQPSRSSDGVTPNVAALTGLGQKIDIKG